MLLVGQELAQEVQVLVAPRLDLHEVVGASDGGSQDQEHDLGKRVDHLPGLARVLERGEMVENGDLPSHGGPLPIQRPTMNHTEPGLGNPTRPNLTRIQAIALYHRPGALSLDLLRCYEGRERFHQGRLNGPRAGGESLGAPASGQPGKRGERAWRSGPS